MHNNCTLLVACIVLVAGSLTSRAKQNEDSSLTNSANHWRVKQNRGLFGLAKPDFGPFTTLKAAKLDSAVIRKKKVDSRYIGGQFGGDSAGLDISKLLTIEKTTFYTLWLGNGNDTTTAIFSIDAVSHEKRQTFLSRLFSNTDRDEVIDYNRTVKGTIATTHDSAASAFLLERFTSGGRQTVANPFPFASIGGGYLTADGDTLRLETHSAFAVGITLTNPQGQHMAVLAFNQTHPEIWIRNDTNEKDLKAIATLFAVIISVKDF